MFLNTRNDQNISHKISSDSRIIFEVMKISYILNFDQNMECLAVFLDLTKAYNLVEHNILTGKMEKLDGQGGGGCLVRSNCICTGENKE